MEIRRDELTEETITIGLGGLLVTGKLSEEGEPVEVYVDVYEAEKDPASGRRERIFGQNSSGKSSILQSLNLLKQTRESRDVEALLLPRTENGIADLGSFQEMLFDHDLKRTLTIRLDVALDENQQPVGAVGYQVDQPSQLVKGIELVAKTEGLRGHLCGVRIARAIGEREVEPLLGQGECAGTADSGAGARDDGGLHTEI